LIFNILQSITILLFPILAIKINKRIGKDWLSPVILCYSSGIALANLKIMPINESIADYFSQGTILFAIPLLLYSTDIIGWFKLAKSTILSFVVCIISGLLMTLLVSFFYRNEIDHIPHLAGMITGIYTGGIPNMNAIGIATHAPEKLFIYLNAADVLVGGLYLVFLTSFAPKLFGIFLPKFETKNLLSVPFGQTENQLIISNLKEILIAVGLTILIIGASASLTKMITGQIASIGLIILLLTSFSVFASFSKRIRVLRGSYDLGDYLLLMFCIAIGMLADFQNFLSEGIDATLFMGSIWLGMVLIHLLFSWLLKIDRDTTMITSTAALYGPPFIGQIANVIKNRTLVFSGIATGLLGYAIGNFIGIGVYSMLQMFLN
jgi:uncharacterized membrane protein